MPFTVIGPTSTVFPVPTGKPPKSTVSLGGSELSSPQSYAPTMAVKVTAWPWTDSPCPLFHQPTGVDVRSETVDGIKISILGAEKLEPA